MIEPVRLTYPQDWSAYNTAQVEEGPRFRALLGSLCDLVEEPQQARGRPRLSLADMTFASVLKVYDGRSSRRFVSALCDAEAEGYITHVPHFNSVSNYLSDPALKPILKDLIAVSAMPLRSIESDFAVDSSGFATSGYVRWYAKQHQRVLDNREWVKAHIMVGVNTGVVTSVEISDWTANDNPFLIPLVQDTAERFEIREVSADKQYVGRANTTAIEEIGATPFIPFKVNSVVTRKDEGSAWWRMYYYFAYRRDEFMEHYHKRSNVESTFGAIKAKFGGSVRSKKRSGQVNEVLAKVLAHNLTVLIREIEALGLDVDFCAGLPAATGSRALRPVSVQSRRSPHNLRGRVGGFYPKIQPRRRRVHHSSAPLLQPVVHERLARHVLIRVRHVLRQRAEAGHDLRELRLLDTGRAQGVAHVLEPAADRLIVDHEREVTATQSGMPVALRVPLLATEPLFEEQQLLRTPRVEVARKDGAQHSVEFHAVVEVLDDALDRRAAADALEQRRLATGARTRLDRPRRWLFERAVTHRRAPAAARSPRTAASAVGGSARRRR